MLVMRELMALFCQGNEFVGREDKLGLKCERLKLGVEVMSGGVMVTILERMYMYKYIPTYNIFVFRKDWAYMYRYISFA